MRSDMESQTSSLVSHERQLVVYLQLTSLSGEDYQIQSISKNLIALMSLKLQY